MGRKRESSMGLNLKKHTLLSAHCFYTSLPLRKFLQLSLQRLGGHGRSPQNTHRDLCRLHFKSLLTPVSHMVTTSVRIRGTFGEPTGNEGVPVMLPHMWVQSLEQHELLQDSTAKPGDLASFWKPAAGMQIVLEKMWTWKDSRPFV